jgi:5'-methylthioadenosine phosphorylase
MPSADWTIGVIGGSGLYEIDGLEKARWERVESPWGEPSDDVLRGAISGVDFVFLPRHGRGHMLSPSDLNSRANIDVLKRAGVTDVLSMSACGSLKETLAPGTFVAVDQFIDRTFARPKSFFGKGCVAHVSMADPVCRRLTALAAEAARDAGVEVVEGGTYLCIEGPQFSSRAESELYRGWGCDVIGMTNMPEAKLAREAELPYASIAMVTDYDCWHDDHGAVEVATVIAHLLANADRARGVVKALAKTLSEIPRTPSPQAIETCLDQALITAPDKRDPKALAKLDAVAGRALNLRA